MRHRRRVVVPSARYAGRATGGVALLAALLAMGWFALRPADFSWPLLGIPLAVVLACGVLETLWVAMNAPRTILADENGLEIKARDGRAETLAWTDLASRERGLLLGGMTLRRKNGSVLRLSALGVPLEGWRDLDARVTDVVELRGPPVAPAEAGGPAPAAAEEPAPPPGPATILAGLSGALLGAVPGVLAWGLIVYWTSLEIGWVAIFLGIFIGAGAVRMGGRGTAMGAACAVLALFSILTGKAFAAGLCVRREMAAQEAAFDRAKYDGITRDAEDWAEGVPEEGVRTFMVSRGYSRAPTYREVKDEEVAEFRKVVVPFLERWRVLPPPFEAWQEEARENFREQVRTNLSVPGLVFSNLKPLDALFFLLGATAAFRIGRGRVLPDIRRGPGGRTTPGGLPRRTQGAPGGIEIRPPVVRKQGIVFRRRKEPPPPEGGDVRN